MSLESGTYVQDLQQSNPPGTDKKKQGDDHLRLIKTVLKNTFPNATRAQYFPRSRTVTTSGAIAATDNQADIICDATGGAITLTLPALGAGDDGFSVRVTKSDASANAINISGTVNGTTVGLGTDRYRSLILFWSGTAWFGYYSINGQAQVTNSLIADDAITNAKLADNSVNSAELVALSVLSTKLADNAVTTAKILDGNVTNQKLAGPRMTMTTLLSGSGNYSPPANCKSIRVRAIGGGAGGGGTSTTGGNGGTTSFNGVDAAGGSFGGLNLSGGSGGTGGAGSATFRIAGADGFGNTVGGGGSLQNGMNGGSGVFGGGGKSGIAGKANTGGGGGGGWGSNAIGAGGGSGEYFELVIQNPVGPYAYTVGAGGSAGTGGSPAPGAGGSGVILIEEYY